MLLNLHPIWIPYIWNGFWFKRAIPSKYLLAVQSSSSTSFFVACTFNLYKTKFFFKLLKIIPYLYVNTKGLWKKKLLSDLAWWHVCSSLTGSFLLLVITVSLIQWFKHQLLMFLCMIMNVSLLLYRDIIQCHVLPVDSCSSSAHKFPCSQFSTLKGSLFAAGNVCLLYLGKLVSYRF